MSTPRRRIVRPHQPVGAADRQRRLQKLRSQLERERTALARWQKRLRRAFTTVEKLHKQIDRLERRRSLLEGNA